MTGEQWTQTALGDVVREWTVGTTPPRTNPEFFTREGGTPWVKAEDVRGGTLLETAERLSEAGGSRMRLVQKDAVLVTTAGTIGRAAVAGRPVFCNQAVQALSFREDLVLPLYGYYALLCQRPLLKKLAGKAVIPSISKGKLQEVPIRFPPLRVQEEMIARMRDPEALLQKAERFQSLLGEYLLALTVWEAREAKRYRPVRELLAEPPLTGLRVKASPTGNGIPLVNKLAGGGPLDTLGDCQRVQVSELQASRYGLCPMDVLLRNSAPRGGVRGALTLELPEEALVGGNLTRLRLESRYMAPWLLAWLTGPGGGQLYVNGKLQKRLLEQYWVPVPEDPDGFCRKYMLALSLEGRAESFAGYAEALFQSVLELVFSKSAGAGTALQSPGDSRLDSRLSRLTGPMNRFLQELSQSQRELYGLFLRTEGGEPVHTLLRRRRGTAGIQDALSTFALLEQFGLVERESPQYISMVPDEVREDGGDVLYIADHNKQRFSIDAYRPTEDIFGENAYAAGTGEDTTL